MTGARFLYVSRLPPSPSGVARYAGDFSGVLAQLGTVTVVRLPAEPARSQRVRTVVAVLGRVLRERLREGPDVVCWVELAGRGIAEAAGALACSLLFRTTCVTVHDAPAVTGGAGYLAVLDRRGGRRVAAAISRTVGARFERAVLRDADRVFALSDLGARAVEARYGTRCRTLPHVVATPAPEDDTDELVVYLPGYVSGALPVKELAAFFRALGRAGGRLLVGSADEDALTVLRTAAGAAGAGQLDERGFQSEEEIDRSFALAALVLKILPSDGTGVANWAAVSGPVLRALAHGCVVVTNDHRGTSEYVAGAHAVLVSGAGNALRAATALLGEPLVQLRGRGSDARSFHASTSSVERVRRCLLEVLL